MIKKLIAAAIIFGIASSAGFLSSKKSIGIRSAFAAANAFIDENDRVVLHGNIHRKARPEFDVGPTDPSLPMKRTILLLKIAPEKQAELDRLVAEQQDRSSTNFHRWLTPEEFGERFGRSPEEIAAVKGWLISHGFTIDETAKGGTWIDFSGTVADVDRAFHANMHDYQVEEQLHHANSTDPSIPRALADVVAGPVSLHNFPRKAMHTPPRHIFDAKQPQAKPQPGYTVSASNHNLAPGDFAEIYDVNKIYSLGYDGTNVTIAVVEQTNQGEGAFAKWNTFRSTFGLPYHPPVVRVNTDPGDTGAADDSEEDLDVEWSGAVATGATIICVVSGGAGSAFGVDLSAKYIVDNNMADIISDSYGDCEPDLSTTYYDSVTTWSLFYYDLWEQAASQGITVFVVTGDSGAYACTDDNGNPEAPKAVNGLASTPFNTAVGGTQLSDLSTYWSPNNSTNGTSALPPASEAAWSNYEVAWNNFNAQNSWVYWASGGGASALYPKPAWQVAPGVPNDGARDMPDVSLNADTNVGYRVYSCYNSTGSCGSDYWSIIGGTSGASPTLAGIMALIVQSKGERQGNFNSVFYQLGNAQYSGASGASPVFHDITKGNNGFGAEFPGYSCTAHYDLVTGLGSVNATNLLLAFQEVGALTVTINPAAAASDGAQWSVDGGAAQNSGAAVSLAAGSPTVSFNTITGWTTPASQTVNIVNGQVTSASATYVLIPPVVETFTIDSGALSTPSPTVTLNNTVTGIPAYYIASESPIFTGAVWKAYSTAPSFTMSGTNGQKKTVYFKVKNAAGVSAKASASIVLALVPVVTSFKIDAGAATTTNPKVTLNNTATESPTHYMASEDPSFAGVVPQPYSTAPEFPLSAGGGTKTVYFEAINSYGSSLAAKDTIELPPVLTSFSIDSGALTTLIPTVTLDNTATGSPTYYVASQSKTFSGAVWKKYSTDPTWNPTFTLSGANGPKIVYFKLRNAAGASNMMSATITLDLE
jgi:pseudomonalisin